MAIELEEAGLAPIFYALKDNTGLVELYFGLGEQISPVFARDVVLPSVRANTSLRKLVAGFGYADPFGGYPPPAEFAKLEVEDILAARRLAEQEAA